MNPRFHAFRHVAHPLAGVDGQVTDQFERRQRSKREFGRKITGQRTAGQTGLAVNQHRAAAANTGTAHEVELKSRILVIAKFIQKNEQRHRISFFAFKRLHVRHACGISRVVAQDADLEHAVLLLHLSTHLSQLLVIKRGVHRCVRSYPAGASAAGRGTA